MIRFFDSAIIYYIYNSNLNGSILNAYEYFICAYQYNPDIKLIFLEADEECIDHFTRTVEDRYMLDDIPLYKENVIVMKRRDLLRCQFNRLLALDYGSMDKLKGLVATKELLIITEVMPHQKELILRKDLYPVTYYGEMPFHYWDVKYRMKFLFDRYKPLKKVEEAIYVNSPENRDRSFLEELDLPDKPLIFKARRHQNNLFELFDTYVYYHANKWFDPHPRMILECAHYKKDIFYFNKYNVKDGSYYRFKDWKERGLEDRTLTKEDEIIRKLI